MVKKSRRIWPMFVNWVDAIGSILSAITACLSLGAFLYAMKMQREDSINDVRPELLLLNWSIEDKPVSNIGPYTSVKTTKIKNVGRGPAFDISFMSVDTNDAKREFQSAIMICPYVASGTEEPIEIGFITQWRELPPEEIKEFVDVRLFYTDLGRHRHSVRMHLVVAKSANYNFSGAKRLAERLFMTRRETTVIEKTIWDRTKGKARRAWASWLKATEPGSQT
jgi:hypothetical protein